MSQALTSFGAPMAGGASLPAARKRPQLTRRQKAAIIVRLLLKEGARLKLDELPEAMQVELTHEMGALRTVDKDTLNDVVAEFMAEMQDLGASFPGGLEGALDMLDGALSEPNLRRVRKETGVIVRGDPWAMIVALEVPDLVAVVQRESPEIAAVILSKLPVAKSAQMLAQLPGELARRITYAVSTTSTVDPSTVRTIGHAIAAQLADESPRAFTETPVARIGAILNSTRAETREGVLDGLTEDDADLGAQVRRTIFTFTHIPARIEPADIPKLTRAVDQALLVTALAGCTTPDETAAADFILDNMSRRMSVQLREDIDDRGTVRPTEAEEAMAEIITAIRDMERAGEVKLIVPDG